MDIGLSPVGLGKLGRASFQEVAMVVQFMIGCLFQVVRAAMSWVRNAKLWIILAMFANLVITGVFSIVAKDDHMRITLLGFGTTIMGILVSILQQANHTELCHKTQEMVRQTKAEATKAKVVSEDTLTSVEENSRSIKEQLKNGHS